MLRSVELTTNALGDEIVKMLKQSSDFANALANFIKENI